jgi:predicted DNA binding CopG/RHH family protein/predicted DNA-binding protein
MNKSATKSLPKTAEELDRRFDAGEDLESLGFDLSKATRPGLEGKRINIDLPAEFLEALDKEAGRRGITRQSLIKVWLYDRLHNSGAIERIRILDEINWALPKQPKSMRESVIKMLESQQKITETLEDLKSEAEALKKLRSPKYRTASKKISN